MAEQQHQHPEPHRILVVDDEPNIVDVVAMALPFHGFAVESAATGTEALAAVTAFRPHLILLDVMLPDMARACSARPSASSSRAPTTGCCAPRCGRATSDAQCGFKALRADAARALLPGVRDDGWFFDTELLTAAQRCGLRIHEVPVDWVDDADSRVDVVATAWGDLRGVARLMAASRVVRFAAVGIASTLAYAALYLGLRAVLSAAVANAMALAVTALANTAANRRLTFGVRGRTGLVRQHALGAVVFALTLALTSAALAVLQGLAPHAPHGVEALVLVAASACATVTRYVALRWWVLADRRKSALDRVGDGRRRRGARRSARPGDPRARVPRTSRWRSGRRRGSARRPPGPGPSSARRARR